MIDGFEVIMMCLVYLDCYGWKVFYVILIMFCEDLRFVLDWFVFYFYWCYWFKIMFIEFVL